MSKVSNLKLKQLEAFCAIVEHGSFTKAAEKLFLSQSTVSSHIQGLESVLNVLLFRRDVKKQIRLTDDGKRVYQHAKAIITRCRALEEDLVTDNESEVIIGASTLPSHSFLPGLVTSFLSLYPDFRCDIRDGDTERIHEMLLDGDIQIGFVGSADNRKALTYERIAEDRLVLAAPNNSRFAAMKAAGANGLDLLKEPLILRESGSGTQKIIDNFLSEMDIEGDSIHVVARVSRPEVLRDLVIGGAGVSILSEVTIREQEKNGELISFDLGERPFIRSIYLATRRKIAHSRPMRAFVAHTEEWAKKNLGI
jgi:DNA-binding transcriptional LysR family regulator